MKATMGAMGAIMGIIVPTAIATPTITILIPIIHGPTTIIPLAGITRVIRGKAAAGATATAAGATATVAGAMATVAGAMATVAGAAVRTAIIDLVLDSSGSLPAAPSWVRMAEATRGGRSLSCHKISD